MFRIVRYISIGLYIGLGNYLCILDVCNLWWNHGVPLDCSEMRMGCLGSLEPVLKCQKPVALTLLVWRLVTRGEPLGKSLKSVASGDEEWTAKQWRTHIMT